MNIATKITIALIALLSVHFASAQNMAKNAQITWADFKLESKNVFLLDVVHTNEGYTLLKKEPIKGPGGYQYYLQKLDKNLNHVETSNITRLIDEDNFSTRFDLIKMGKNYNIFSSSWNKKERTCILYVQTIDTEKMTASKRRVVEKVVGEKKRFWFTLNRSHNGNYVLASIRGTKGAWREQYGQGKVSLILLDSEGNVSWKREDYVYYEKSAWKYSLEQTLVSDAGLVYLLGKNELDEDTNFDMAILTKNGVRKKKIEVESAFLNSIKMNMNLDNEIFAFGYYRKTKKDKITGVFSMKLDGQTAKVLSFSKQEFSTELIKSGETAKVQEMIDKKKKKGKDLKLYGLNYLQPRAAISHADGSMSIVGEVYYVTTHTKTDSKGNVSTYYVYHWDDVLVTRIDKGGVIVANAKINKASTKQSHISFGKNGRVHLVFNDNRKNLLEQENIERFYPEPGKNRDLALTLVTVDGGTYDRAALIDYGDPKYEPYRRYSIYNDLVLTDQNELFMCTYYGKKKFGLARVVID